MKAAEPPERPSPEFGIGLTAALLVGLGLVMSYSSSYSLASVETGNPAYFLVKQILAAILGCGCLVAIRWMPRSVVRGLAPAAPLLGLILLVAVLFLGPVVRGQAESYRRWFSWHGVSFQPSEVAKICLVMGLAWLADWFDGRDERYGRFFFFSLALVASYGLLIAAEPDLGVAMLMFGVGMAILFAAGARARHLLGVAAVLIGFLLVFALDHTAEAGGASGNAFLGHLVSRLTAFLTPGIDRSNPEEYQAWLCLLALGSGGIFGRGLCESVFKFGYLPARHTDSIMAVVGEELGLLGTLAVVVLFIWLASSGYAVAARSRDRFSKVLAFGLTTLLAGQAALNMLVVTYTLPTIGEPLPFVSYGGTSLLTSLAAVGLLLHLARPAPHQRGRPRSPEEVRGNASCHLHRRNRRTRLSRSGDR